MANLSQDKSRLKKVEVKPKVKARLKAFDMTHIEVNFFDVLKAMQRGKVKTVLDLSTGERVLVTQKMYQQLLKAA